MSALNLTVNSGLCLLNLIASEDFVNLEGGPEAAIVLREYIPREPHSNKWNTRNGSTASQDVSKRDIAKVHQIAERRRYEDSRDRTRGTLKRFFPGASVELVFTEVVDPEYTAVEESRLSGCGIASVVPWLCSSDICHCFAAFFSINNKRSAMSMTMSTKAM